MIKSDPSLMTVLYFVGIYSQLLNCFWINKTFFDAKFQEGADFSHFLGGLLRVCFLATAVLFIRPIKYMANIHDRAEMLCFCIACWGGMLYHLFLHLEITLCRGVHSQEATYCAVTELIISLPSFLCITTAAIYSGIAFYLPAQDSLPGDDTHEYTSNRILATVSDEDGKMYNHVPIILLLCSYIFRLALHVPVLKARARGKDHKESTVPVNIQYTLHRYGELIMLMLGESVLSILIVEIQEESTKFYLTFYIGVVSVILMQYLYYKSQPHDYNNHAIRRSLWSAYFFAVTVQVYCATLIVVGVSYKMLLTQFQFDAGIPTVEDKYQGSIISFDTRLLAGEGEGYEGGGFDLKREQAIANFFCISMAISFLCLDVMNILHKGVKQNIDRCSISSSSSQSFFHRQLKSGAIIPFLRVACSFFIGTACLYVTKPLWVALTGLFSIIFQVCVRFLGEIFYPSPQGHHGHDDIAGNNSRSSRNTSRSSYDEVKKSDDEANQSSIKSADSEAKSRTMVKFKIELEEDDNSSMEDFPC